MRTSNVAHCLNMALRERVALLTLALVLHKTAAAPYTVNYIVDPITYLDVVYDSDLQPDTGRSGPGCTHSNSTAAAKGGACGVSSASRSNQQYKPYGIHANTSSSFNLVPYGRQLQQQAAPNLLRLQKPYNVCISHWAPMVYCDPGDDAKTYKGYQVELFRMLAHEVGWALGDYKFTCMDYDAMMADLNNPAGNCSLSAAGVEASLENLAAGLKFSWPTYKSGLRVMVHTHLQVGNTWGFAKIFAWDVWLVLGITTVAVGLLIALLEWLNGKYTKAGEWQSWVWYSISQMAHVVPHVGDPGSDGARALALGYGIIVMIMVSRYTAIATVHFTATELVHPVHDDHDLAGPNSPYKTMTWDRYVDTLAEHQHISAYGKPWRNDADLDDMIAGLRNLTYAALILDAPVLEHIAGQNEACDLFLVGDSFKSFSVALAFPPAFHDAVIYNFSQSFIKLQHYQGAPDMLEGLYITTGGTDRCYAANNDKNAPPGSDGAGETIELRQVSGLWVILAAGVVLCFMLTLARNMRKDPEKWLRIKRLRTVMLWSGTGGHEHGHDGHSSGHGGWWRGSIPPWLRPGPAVSAGLHHVEHEKSRFAAEASRLHHGDAISYWGQGPATAKPAFAELFAGSAVTQLSDGSAVPAGSPRA